MSFDRVEITDNDVFATEQLQTTLVLSPANVKKAMGRVSIYPPNSPHVSFYFTRDTLLRIYSEIEKILLESSDEQSF